MNIRTISQPVRGCGKRREWGVYLVSAEGGENGALPHYSVIDTPIPTQRKAHRTPVTVDGNAILNLRPEVEWLVGVSAHSADIRAGQVWEIEMFGMLTRERLTLGDCVGLQTEEEALLKIADLVTISPRVSNYVRDMSMAGVAEMQGCSAPFASMIRYLQGFVMTGNVSDGTSFIGAVWRLAGAAHKKNRSLIIPPLSAILMLSGLKRDAVALVRQYPVEE